MRLPRIAPVVFALLAGVLPRPSRAQSTGGWPASTWCYGDVSRDGCHWFMVTELSGFYGLSGLDYEYTVPGYAGTSYTYRYRTGRMTAQGTFGVMRNRGPWALGASVAAVASSADDHPTVAFLRARRWLDRRTGVDLAFSPRLTHDGAWIGEAWYGTADFAAVGRGIGAGGGRERLFPGIETGADAGQLGGSCGRVSSAIAMH